MSLPNSSIGAGAPAAAFGRKFESDFNMLLSNCIIGADAPAAVDFIHAVTTNYANNFSVPSDIHGE